MAGNRVSGNPRKSRLIHRSILTALLAGAAGWHWACTPSQSGGIKTDVVKPAVAHSSAAQVPPKPLNKEAGRRAKQLLDRLRKSPGDPLLLAELGKIYYQDGQFSQAVKYYRDSAKIKPDPVVLVKLGGAYHFDGDDENAISAWDGALRLDPGNPDALFNIGFVQWRERSNRKEAIAAWQRLVDSNPNHPKRAQVEKLLAEAKRHPDIPKAAN